MITVCHMCGRKGRGGKAWVSCRSQAHGMQWRCLRCVQERRGTVGAAMTQDAMDSHTEYLDRARADIAATPATSTVAGAVHGGWCAPYKRRAR